MAQPQLEIRSPEAPNWAPADARARGIAAIRFDKGRPSRRARGLPSKCIVKMTMVFISILMKRGTAAQLRTCASVGGCALSQQFRALIGEGPETALDGRWVASLLAF